VQVVREHPWPAVALAAGAGFLLARSRFDSRAAAATVAATGGASSKLGSVLDEAASRVISGVSGALQERVDDWVEELKGAIGAPGGRAARTDGAFAAEALDLARETESAPPGADWTSGSPRPGLGNPRGGGTPLSSSVPR